MLCPVKTKIVIIMKLLDFSEDRFNKLPDNDYNHFIFDYF